MIANYLKPPSGIYSQSQIASCFFVLPINWGALPTQMRRAIDFAVLREGTARIVGNTISLESMVNEINDYDPIEIRVKYPNNAGGHAMVIEGYDIKNRYVHIIDPYINGKQYWISRDLISKKYRYEAGLGTYENTITVDY